MVYSGTRLWTYLSEFQKSLALDGNFLLSDVAIHHDSEPTDYSYLVFPYAKLYEGFLKDLFLDLGIIDYRDYASEHYRIGKALSPNLVRRLGKKSAYGRIEDQYGKGLATQLWHTWKNGRNLVFHYFPHNFRALTLQQAKDRISLIVDTMTAAVETTKVERKMRRS